MKLPLPMAQFIEPNSVALASQVHHPFDSQTKYLSFILLSVCLEILCIVLCNVLYIESRFNVIVYI